MITFQDLEKVSETQKGEFVLQAITEWKSTKQFRTAVDAEQYATNQNATIKAYQKILYTFTGEGVPDTYSANHKCASGFFRKFIIQEASYTLKNGVTFEDDKTYDKLGDSFNDDLYEAVRSALATGCSFGFFNYDHVDFFKLTEFVPLYDETDGALKAGIRFWQIDNDKPLRATLYEIDGYTDYIQNKEEQIRVLNEKRTYIEKIKTSVADGDRIYEQTNYPTFPIVPLWVNLDKQSELVGIREQIDAYDLIKSGFANDLDDASLIYWIIENNGGMDDVDIARFLERLKTVHAATVDTEDGGKVEAHTMDIPYQSREAYLTRLERDLYRDFMALDTDRIAAGQVTATQIESAYEPLDEKAFELQSCLTKFIKGILAVAGIDDNPSYNPSRIVNRQEETQMILSAAEYLDDATILEKLPFLTDEEVDDILESKTEEEAGRFELEEELAEDEETDTEESDVEAELSDKYLGELGDEITKLLEGLLED